ncbi:acetaldehyde dehydrogenase (acetylating) [Geobacillus thermocatenulatus]|uniref:Acetaldehyde dehydrogenase (Acetylating) n=1 Tax=Geobacillus thermocatenulatus TaxID=33938 RepID=A0AA91YVQ0_9BACL|nr:MULTISPECIES: acetaldehyde dehydrogenase (acetylating) [Geobacillus]OXB90182.1 acetaldehyde dehydrogenase (acetylating) [Geobacillus thermocatenulatus]
MMADFDLLSVQEARNLLYKAREAQKKLTESSQEQIDRIVERMALEAEKQAGFLARMAAEETGFGNETDKTIKNIFAAKEVYVAIKDMKTVGIISTDKNKQVWEIAEPVGVIAGVIPSTNPTSTIIFKSLIAVKSRNAIVFSPHPSALKCSLEAAKIMAKAAKEAGAPENIIQCMEYPSLPGTRELMSHKLTDVILATGGPAMVKAAYSSGKPAYGVGPGNVPVYVHTSADLDQAARHIIESKSFDYGTICASEQAVVVEREIKQDFIDKLKKYGAYLLSEIEKERIESILLTGGTLNPKIVGKSPQAIGKMAGLFFPAEIKVLIGEEKEIGKHIPFSIEKLSPILALYTVDGWEEGCDVCIKLLEAGGLGHTFGIHCQDQAVIKAFALKQPASRIVVNSGTAFGGIGATTGIFPSLTLGCGSYGNNITSDNIGPQHLINIKRVAFGIKGMMIKTTKSGTLQPAKTADASETEKNISVDRGGNVTVSREEIAEIVKRILSEMKI